MPSYPTRRNASLGQACCNALAAWLQSQLDPSIVVYNRFPDASVARPPSPARTVTVLRVGKRKLEDLLGTESIVSSGPTGVPVIGQNATTQYAIGIGHFTQAIELHCEAESDPDLDDVIDELDDALNMGTGATLPSNAVDALGNPIAADDPVRHGILLPFLAVDRFAGNIAFAFDEVEQILEPGLLQKHMHAAVYSGEARGAFQRLTEAQAILKIENGITASTT